MEELSFLQWKMLGLFFLDSVINIREESENSTVFEIMA